MVLRPVVVPTPSQQPVPAWSAVSERQKCSAQGFWLISQPDHAGLSGQLAAHFISERFPAMNPLLTKIVAVHDVGWAAFPGESSLGEPPLLTPEGRPRAFTEFAPPQFLSAWTTSIEGAEKLAPAGGIIVSRHFCELGGFRLRQNDDLCPDELELIRGFMGREEARQERLLRECPQPAQQLEQWLAVLQFCDLLSLYLCSGAEGEADFPPGLADQPVRVSHKHGEELYRLDPSPFQDGGGRRTLNMEVNARHYPSNGALNTTKLRFLLC
jgi:hypothetical protein